MLSVKFISILPEHITKVFHLIRCSNEEHVVKCINYCAAGQMECM